MAFIRKKATRAGRTTYQVVKSVREGGKVKQKVLVCLSCSPTIAEAIQRVEDFIADHEHTARLFGGPADRDRLNGLRREVERMRKVQAETGLP